MQATLAGVLGRISPAVMARAQVLVIDDGSKDDTRGAYETFVAGEAGVAGSESAGDNRGASGLTCAAHLQYIRFEFNRGYGAVVKMGISEGLRSGAKYIACLHGDGQYPAEQLGEFFAHLESARNQPEVSTPASNQPENTAGKQPAIALVQGSRRLVPGA
ncbi:MAG: glycosyltransferase, partial [Kiritimatiellae bacterium]|nr:glycosyltransferase [Kiritimatiellia bacterium]